MAASGGGRAAASAELWGRGRRRRKLTGGGGDWRRSCCEPAGATADGCACARRSQARQLRTARRPGGSEGATQFGECQHRGHKRSRKMGTTGEEPAHRRTRNGRIGGANGLRAAVRVPWAGKDWAQVGSSSKEASTSNVASQRGGAFETAEWRRGSAPEASAEGQKREADTMCMTGSREGARVGCGVRQSSSMGQRRREKVDGGVMACRTPPRFDTEPSPSLSSNRQYRMAWVCDRNMATLTCR